MKPTWKIAPRSGYLNAFPTCVAQLDFLQCQCKSCTTWAPYIQRSLGHVGAHRSLSAFGCGNKQAPGWQIHASNRFLPVGEIWFHLCCSLVRTLLYPSSPNLHVAPSKILRPDDSKDTKWTQILNHFHQKYMQFMNHVASMFQGRDDLSRGKVRWVSGVFPFQPSYAYSWCRIIGQCRIL